MDFEEYRKRGKEMVDYIADYLENIRERRVFPDVKPGYMHNLLPESAPVDGEKWENIVDDIERVIMPGITHWQSPHMHAYFPALNSFPSMLGDMLADAINCLGFTWASSPACTELETIVMNWLGKMIGLPDEFLHLNNSSKGGGVIQTTASESTLVCLLAGRTQAIKKFHEQTPGYQDAEINARLVAYCSDQAHSSVEKAALIGLVRMRYIESNDELIMNGKPLKEAIENDIKQGLIPFWVCCTLGTTGACAFDNLDEIGNVCREFGLWLHIDAAYAGSALICPEYRIWLKGIEKADSIAFNPSKWLMVHFDCTAMWVKDSTAVHRTFNVEPLYLQHENSGLAIDYMHWQIPLSKRFRSLKLWFVLRSFGIKGLQKHIREGVRLAQKFEALALADHRFEIPAKRHLGMVVFRIKGENELTEKLLKRLNHRGKLHCVPSSLKGKYIIRFTVTSTRTTIDDILEDWNEIKLVTSELLDQMNVKIDRAKVALKDTKEKNEAFGSSLLLSNSPMSPKVVNGSFAAIFDADEFLAKTYAGIRIANPTTLQTKLPPLRPLIKRPTNFKNFQHQDSPSMRRRVRGILMSGKQFSLDSRMDLVVQSCYDSNNDHKKANPIHEDNEEVFEVYETLGTPPLTPPPTISPMINCHLLQHRKPKVKFASKSPMNSTVPASITSTNLLQIEMLDPIRIPNKYKLVDNLTSPTIPPTNNNNILNRQAKTTTEYLNRNFISVNNSFDKITPPNHKKINSTIMKKPSRSERNNCRNCNLSLNLIENNKSFDERTTTLLEKHNKNLTNISTESCESNEKNLDFKSTVNTVTVCQNFNLSSNQHKSKVSSNHYKNKSNPQISTQQKKSPTTMILNSRNNSLKNVTTKSFEQSSSSSEIYHGKRFLEQSTNDGIFAFYNLAFRAASSQVQQCNSMSDISEEDLSSIDSVDWEAVKTNFNKLALSSSASSTYTAQNLNRSATVIAKLKQQKQHQQTLSSQSSTDSIQQEINCELNSLPILTQSLSLTGLRIRVANEDGNRIKTSFDSSSSLNQSFDESSRENSQIIHLFSNDELDNKDTDTENKNDAEVSGNESNDDDNDNDGDDDDDDGDDDDEEEENLHLTTTTSSTTSSTSCFSQPISLWSSLDVTDLLQDTGGGNSIAGGMIQIGSDGWTIIPHDIHKNENFDSSDICRKCGHNSSVLTPNELCISNSDSLDDVKIIIDKNDKDIDKDNSIDKDNDSDNDNTLT